MRKERGAGEIPLRHDAEHLQRHPRMLRTAVQPTLDHGHHLAVGARHVQPQALAQDRADQHLLRIARRIQPGRQQGVAAAAGQDLHRGMQAAAAVEQVDAGVDGARLGHHEQGILARPQCVQPGPRQARAAEHHDLQIARVAQQGFPQMIDKTVFQPQQQQQGRGDRRHRQDEHQRTATIVQQIAPGKLPGLGQFGADSGIRIGHEHWATSCTRLQETGAGTLALGVRPDPRHQSAQAQAAHALVLVGCEHNGGSGMPG